MTVRHFSAAFALALAPALSAALALTPTDAHACGGTFCDNFPGALPVDQTGENILFVIDGPTVEAHIQIQYDPDTNAEKFAWVVPLQSVPDFSVGSDPLFTNLLAGSVPTYQLNTQSESCGGNTEGSGGSGGWGTMGGTDGGYTDPEPEVLLQETVGAFDIVVLQGQDVDGLMQWLADNDYEQDPDAAPIFQEYIDESFLFAAFKLTQDAGVDQIHPVVLSFDSSEPCVPLRLTRIAAADDMEVRAFFLGNARTVPTNYRHVVINPVMIDWLDLSSIATQYKELITLAVDAFGADGHAFVTEYAGSSDVVSDDGLWSPSWSAASFDALAAIDVIDTLESQGILNCSYGCEFYHPLIEGLVAQYLPVPDGLSPEEFYGCLSCYEGLIDQNAWDGPAFAAAYQSRIIDPGARATELLATWPYLTRLYTTISPAEMTVDPIFHQKPDLPEVSADQTANRYVYCDGSSRVTLPDGREVYVPGGSWPNFPDEMPWEEDIEAIPIVGATQSVVDNTELINRLLAEWNQDQGWPNGGGGTSGTEGTEGTDSGADDGEGGGCGCATEADDGRGRLGLLALALLGLRRARRRRATRAPAARPR